MDVRGSVPLGAGLLLVVTQAVIQIPGLAEVARRPATGVRLLGEDVVARRVLEGRSDGVSTYATASRIEPLVDIVPLAR